MCYLPTRDFKWIDLTDPEFDNESFQDSWPTWRVDQPTGWILDVDLEYPEHLHHEHRENPLAPFTEIIEYHNLSPTSKELLKENKVKSESYSAKKMITSLGPRVSYVTHYMNLKL